MIYLLVTCLLTRHLIIGTPGWNDGNLNTVLFSIPYYLSIDSMNNVYLADIGNSIVRQINFNTNTIITIAGYGGQIFTDGIGSIAGFDYPTHVYVNPAGTIMYVTDYDNNRIRQISCSTGMLLSILLL